jgi:hypothetical protein
MEFHGDSVFRSSSGQRSRVRYWRVGFCTLLVAGLCGCGGGGTQPPPPPPPTPTPDFSLSIQPTTVSVVQGSSATFSVSLTGSNGFNSQASVSVTGLPVGVTAAPAKFNMSPGGQQTVMLEAAATALVGTANLTATATSGSLTHSGQLSLAITSLQITANAPLRTKYVRTDAQWEVGYLNFAPQPWILYNPGTKRFFVSNTAVNRVDVLDAATESKVGEITVPGAWVADESSDYKTIYIGTQIGDIYEIDPLAMAVSKRIPLAQIGPSGFPANVVRVLADGRLALLYTGAGGLSFIDCNGAQLGVWNPTDNSLQIHAGGCVMTLTADRTKIIIFRTGSPSVLTLFDPTSGVDQSIQIAEGPDSVIVPPDGKEILLPFGPGVAVYDSSSLALVDQFQVGDGQEGFSYILSSDGNTLFAVSRITPNAFSVDWRTHQQKGWLANFSIQDVVNGITPMAADETSLIAGVIGHGVGFLDGGVVLPAAPKAEMSICCYPLQPTFGPVQGGTQVQETGVASTLSLVGIYFGDRPATQVSAGSQSWFATTPAAVPGPVNVRIAATDGGLVLLPEAYSYGPSVVELTTNSTTAEGGGTGTIYGYGFDAIQSDGTGSALKITLGVQSATITKFLGLGYVPAPGLYPFPLESVQFTIPAGTPGATADLTISNNAGTVTQPKAITYLPSTQQFPLPGASLAQGTYDVKRDLYYFTDQTQLQIFSRTQGKWLAPVSVKNATRLWALALSPDGSKLVVGDAGNNVIYVLNPDSLGSQSGFQLPNSGTDLNERPAGVVITDSGIVYYASFMTSGTGGLALHKLDTSSGTVTDYPPFYTDVSLGADAYTKMLLSKDNSRVFFNLGGFASILETATDTFVKNLALFNQGDYELALAGNGSWMTAGDYLMDMNLNGESFVSLNEREIWNEKAVYGEKLSTDGTLLFRPLTDALDVVDGRTGILRARISLPVTLSPNYDALVADAKDSVLIAITGQNGDGIALIDLTSVPEPPPLAYVIDGRQTVRVTTEPMTSSTKTSATTAEKVGGQQSTVARRQLAHVMTQAYLGGRKMASPNQSWN